MTINEMRKVTGLTQTAFGELLGIPMRTIQDWEKGLHKCPEYVRALIEYKLRNEGLILKTMYTITRRDDCLNDYCFETIDEAINCCKEKELSNNIYSINKILEDKDGCEAECLAIYSVTGEKEQ